MRDLNIFNHRNISHLFYAYLSACRLLKKCVKNGFRDLMADNCGMHLINQELSGLSKGVDCITNFAHKKLFHSVVEKWKKKLRESY